MSSLSGKVIALTGGASGIGLATAKLLASRGAVLSLADINGKDLEKVVTSLTSSGTKAIGTVVDVTKPEDVKAFISKTVAEFGSLDGAANLAGVIGRNASSTPLRDQDDTEYDFVMNVNVRGVFNCVREELRVMKSGASIVNAASVLGLLAQKNNSIYTASKHAVVGLTRTAAKEEGVNNIRINAIAPGIIDTPMVQDVEAEQKIHKMDTAIQALDRKGKPEEMASIIAFLLSDESSFVTGSIWGADGGWNC
jgi:NAD(P)-dependent dehydrogenase (short-subunit alcohol dehydrogenase family)